MSRNSAPPGLEPSHGGDSTTTSGAFSLENILGENHDEIEKAPTDRPDAAAEGWDEEDTEKPLAEGYCIECEGGVFNRFEVVDISFQLHLMLF